MTVTGSRRIAVSSRFLERRLPERRYLPELHGVRGLALLGVVLFHLFGGGRVSGGIDIFLAVSGFLFTGMLLREAAATGGRLDLLKYFGRLVRRILIPAAIVIAVTLAAGLWIFPFTQHRQLWSEARASLLYFENFELINSQLAYGAAGPETSPFQHFWSLSVQGQFYLVWPLVAILAVVVARALNTSAVRVMSLAVGVILIASIAMAIYVGGYNQDEAYLMTATRAWQLAFGGLLALAGGAIRLPRSFRRPAGWTGVGLIVSCGFLLDGASLFPGPWALWPLLGLMLVLISAGPAGGDKDPVGSATRFLSNRPLAWIGDHAYGLYLWHWPLLIFYMEVRNREAVGFRGAMVILGATVVLAMLMQRYIERPLKWAGSGTSAKRVISDRPIVALAVSMLAVAGVAMSAFTQPSQQLESAYGGLDSSTHPGAAQHFMSTPVPDAEPFPAVKDADQYRQDYLGRGCHQVSGDDPGTDEVTVCVDEEAPDHPAATIVLAGGSHAGHLEAGFKALARKYDWEVLVVLKSSCVFGWDASDDRDMCGRWNENFLDWLEENSVDLVVTPGTRVFPNSGEYVVDAAPEWWSRIAETGTELLLMRGTPRQADSAPDCLARGGSAQDCGPPKDALAHTNPLDDFDLPSGVHSIDMTKYVCPKIEDDTVANCDAIVGNILVWFDRSHLTTPFSQSLAPGFEAEMRQVVPHLLR